jgi:hypothetical protein
LKLVLSEDKVVSYDICTLEALVSSVVHTSYISYRELKVVGLVKL